MIPLISCMVVTMTVTVLAEGIKRIVSHEGVKTLMDILCIIVSMFFLSIPFGLMKDLLPFLGCMLLLSFVLSSCLLLCVCPREGPRISLRQLWPRQENKWTRRIWLVVMVCFIVGCVVNYYVQRGTTFRFLDVSMRVVCEKEQLDRVGARNMLIFDEVDCPVGNHKVNVPLCVNSKPVRCPSRYFDHVQICSIDGSHRFWGMAGYRCFDGARSAEDCSSALDDVIREISTTYGYNFHSVTGRADVATLPIWTFPVMNLDYTHSANLTYTAYVHDGKDAKCEVRIGKADGGKYLLSMYLEDKSAIAYALAEHRHRRFLHLDREVECWENLGGEWRYRLRNLHDRWERKHALPK